MNAMDSPWISVCLLQYSDTGTCSWGSNAILKSFLGGSVMKIAYIHKDDWIADKKQRKTVNMPHLHVHVHNPSRTFIAESFFSLFSEGDLQGSSREFRSRRIRSFVRVHQQTLRHKKEKRRRQTARVHNWCGRSPVLERNTRKIQRYVRKTIVHFLYMYMYT